MFAEMQVRPFDNTPQAPCTRCSQHPERVCWLFANPWGEGRSANENSSVYSLWGLTASLFQPLFARDSHGQMSFVSQRHRDSPEKVFRGLSHTSFHQLGVEREILDPLKPSPSTRLCFSNLHMKKILFLYCYSLHRLLPCAISAHVTALASLFEAKTNPKS